MSATTSMAEKALSRELLADLLRGRSPRGGAVTEKPHLAYPGRPLRRARGRCGTVRKTCCAQIYDILKDLPGVDPAKFRKPKQSSRAKLSCLCAHWPIGDAVGPLMFHLLRRFLERIPPATDLERSVWPVFAGMSETEITALRRSMAAVREAGDLDLRCAFHGAYLALPIEKAVDSDAMALVWMEEGLVHARRMLYGTSSCGPGAVRMFEAELLPDPDRPAKRVTAPWPYILQVQGLRVAAHRPAIATYRDDEYESHCTTSVDPATQAVSRSCVKETWPNCTGSSSGGYCLRVPEARVGQSADIVGFNFFSENVKVRLRKRDKPSLVLDIDALVCGDAKTPVLDNDGQVIVDARVRDRVSFAVPEHMPDGVSPIEPGIYEVEVVVENTAGHARSDGVIPTTYSTASIAVARPLLKILPSVDLDYWVRVSDAHCYDTTDGEWGSDEIRLTATIGRFAMSGGKAVVDNRVSQMPDVMTDVDAGDHFRPDWDLIGNSIAGERLAGSTVIGLIGYEVDSDDAWQEQITNWTSAFKKALAAIWDAIKDKVGEIGKALWSLGIKAGAIAAAVAVVAIIAIAAIWAAWAPPDRMLLDLIVLDEEQLWFMTEATAPLPAAREERYDDVRVTVEPETRFLNEYVEERRYHCDSEGSDYGLVFAYRRCS